MTKLEQDICLALCHWELEHTKDGKSTVGYEDAIALAKFIAKCIKGRGK